MIFKDVLNHFNIKGDFPDYILNQTFNEVFLEGDLEVNNNSYKISITTRQNVTHQMFIDDSNNQQKITLEQLSAGEKQMLLILLTVFLMDCKPAILLMDEPELSLHVTWQEKLISSLRKLNPNCQLILTTHSPSIFAMGWEDKLVFTEDIITFTNGK